MCKNAQNTVVSLMEAIEPTITLLGNQLKLTGTPAFNAALTDYSTALAAVQSWKSGTPAEDVIEAVTDLEGSISALPIPVADQALVNIVLAGIATVIGVLTANSPAPLTATAA